MIDIKGLDKAEVLHALYHGTAPLGLGILHNQPDFSVEDARQYTERALRFDYIAGRPIKANLEGDEFDPRWFDRDAGRGAAEAAISRLRK